ncbi:External alternative NAD(P)H-ubiquinone oxidoreductase B1, mitochondrial [Asimina triloba]
MYFPEDISHIFKVADKDKSGTLTVKEFQDVIDDIRVRYPQVELYLKSKHMGNVVDLLNDSKGNETKVSFELDIEGFESALCRVDSQTKSLPATAQDVLRNHIMLFTGLFFTIKSQVAAQQGAYLARCFNHWKKCEDEPEGPLRFRESGTSILVNLLLWEESKQLLNCQETGYPGATVPNGFGILYTQDNVVYA